MQRGSRSFYHIVDTETTAAPEHAVGLAVKRGPIGDVHRDMLSPSDIKHLLGEWQGESIRLAIHHLIRKPRSTRQKTRSINERLTKIDPLHHTAIVLGEISRRTAQSRPDVKNP